MTLRPVPLPAITGVGSTQRAVIEVPCNRIYHEIALQLSIDGALATEAQCKAAIRRVNYNLDSRTQRTFTPKQLFDINRFHGVLFEPGTLTSFLAEPWRRETLGEDGLAWGTADRSSFQIEVDFAEVAGSVQLKADALVKNNNRPTGVITKWKYGQQQVASTGELTTTERPTMEAMYGFHCFEQTAGDIEYIRMQLDGSVVWDMSRKRAETVQRQRGFKPQAGVFHVPFDITNRAADAQRFRDTNGRLLVSEFRRDYTMTAARSFDILQEEVGLPD